MKVSDLFPKRGKEPTSEGEETETKQGEEGDPKTLESSLDPPQTDTGDGVEGPFKSKELSAFGSEQELIDAMALRDLTITEQRAAVETAGMEKPTVVPEPAPEPVTVTSEEFFSDPAKAIRAVTSDVIQTQMKEIVSELRQDMAVGRVKNAWDEAEEKLPNLPIMRPLVEAVLKRGGVANPNVLSIISAHDMAVGEAVRQGVTLPTTETRVEDRLGAAEENRRSAIPQHSPSTQPIVQLEEKVKFEPLDENEARMAREEGITHERFRALQELDEASVLTVEESK